ncbi:hypothetical protein [Variovorax sp. MHTC-1]|uniref:hypothetical protein n=1 Tax=Variovorax sp. MHTC-1 TaxID=2495593 RepID=UPI000F87A223|nr:hypothetical protein [Variovorax sp. MHTC-1]RST48725.1 hypothetical protein EJI01_25845 [Variovorax sp. MHTC-1]
MPLDSKTTQLDLDKQSYVLASLEMSQRDSTRLVPWPLAVRVLPAGATSARDSMPFKIDEEGMDYGDGSRYVALIRIALPPGKYSFAGAFGQIKKFPVNGTWHLPLGLAFELPERSVMYVGRISAELRPKKDHEFRAGSVIPLIDQAATGISGGTFDVVVADRSGIDLEAFRSNFPAMKGVEIKTSVLPPFDRSSIDRAYSGVEKPATASSVSAAQ